MVKLTQTMMADRLMFVDDTQCTVLEVRGVTQGGRGGDAMGGQFPY